ncbi:MAG: Rieske (2Fe-2S) protein [Candidatus Binatus sp.]|uniref:aromatic ring-hydroxylating oxygenase subunit alpha n=1 Tax=Candidatus Binatus sp. TaxID=2811406 RepID=UPI002725EC26|nr:Rieske (2Fe-2S) protein [Candidatus Binatus sp.]MDO8431633.1 Rieske (2Fe-2S) protein [Candidatus Binatus sp.]
MASTTAVRSKRKARAAKPQNKSGGGFHQSWYAIARSDEVSAGSVIGRDFLEGRAIVFRGEDGRACVMNAYCRHLGADLSLGKVIGNDIQCAFHHWQYGADGACTKIPAAEKIPKAARIFKFPTAEKWGLIWAFNGSKPLFDVPEFVGYEEADLDIRTAEAFDLPVEPWVPFTNSMDFQHLRVLHGLKIECDPDAIHVGDYRIQYDVRFEDPTFGIFDQRIRVTGTNTIALAGRLSGMGILSMATGTPTPDGRTHGWSVTATPKNEGTAEERENRLAIGEAFFRRLIQEDEPIMQTIRFHDGLLIDADRALARFLQYVRRFPTASPVAQ